MEEERAGEGFLLAKEWVIRRPVQNHPDPHQQCFPCAMVVPCDSCLVTNRNFFESARGWRDFTSESALAGSGEFFHRVRQSRAIQKRAPKEIAQLDCLIPWTPLGRIWGVTGQSWRTKLEQQLAPPAFHRRTACPVEGGDHSSNRCQQSSILNGQIEQSLHRKGLDDPAPVPKIAPKNRHCHRTVFPRQLQSWKHLGQMPPQFLLFHPRCQVHESTFEGPEPLGVRSRELFSRIGGAHANQFVSMAKAVHQHGKECRVPAHSRHHTMRAADRTPIAALEHIQDGLRLLETHQNMGIKGRSPKTNAHSVRFGGC